VHISSDYVFDGGGGSYAWSPKDQPNPLGAYGRSKLAGEQAVQAAGGAYGILRTSWVFSAHGQNFVKTMLRLSETQDTVRVVSDQIGGPTAAGDIAYAALVMVDALGRDAGKSGIYHFAGAPDVSWAEFARAIFKLAGRRVEVKGIPSSDYPTPAKRPANSRMNCTATQAVFGLQRPKWHNSLMQVLTDLNKAGGL
jgi:dTDP-4-dehydrorhamnose reductase